MIQAFQSFSQSWFAKIFLILVVLSFGAFFGGSQYFIPKDPNATAAQVGEVAISRMQYAEELRHELNQIQVNTGQTPTPEEQFAQGIPQAIISNLVMQTLLNLEADTLGLTVSDEEVRQKIAQTKAFQDKKGNFDRQQFQMIARAMGLPEDAYIEKIRLDMIRMQLISAVAAGAYVPAEMAAPLFEAQYETRAALSRTIDPRSMPKPASPGKVTLEAFYKENQQNFSAPETRSFKILVVRKAPEDSLYTFTQSLDDELAGGTTFEELARTHNIQLISVTDGTNNAAIKELSSDPELESEALATAFETEENLDSPFNESSNGAYYIVRVDAVIPEHPLTFEKAEKRVLQDWQLGEQIQMAHKKSQDLVDGINTGKKGTATLSALPKLSLADDSGNVDDAVKRAIFSLKKGKAGLTFNSEGFVVVYLKNIIPASAAVKRKKFEEFQDQLKNVMANDILNAYLEALKVRYPVHINQKALRSLYS